MCTIGVAIPAHRPHLEHLKLCLASICAQTRSPDDVVVSLSGCTDAEFSKFKSSFKPDIRVRFLVTARRQNASMNRNIAASALNTDYVSFFDADDVMHPQRMEFLSRAIEEEVPDVILHGCRVIRTLSDASPPEEFKFKVGERMEPPRSRNAIGLFSKWAVHNGHPTVKRELWSDHKYDNGMWSIGQDQEFLSRVFKSGDLYFLHLPFPLSDYYRVRDCRPQITNTFRTLNEAVKGGERVEGNIHTRWEPYIFALRSLVKTPFRRILEIGFNAGHSSALWLTHWPQATVKSMDIGIHSYCSSAKQTIDNKFPGRHELVLGDSRVTVPKIGEEKFDFIFIDGGHFDDIPYSDLRNCARLAHSETIVLLDDANPRSGHGKVPNAAWLKMISDRAIRQLFRYENGSDGFVIGVYK